MKTFRKELWFNLPTRRGFVNITPQVEECLRESGIHEGLCLVNANHLTIPLTTFLPTRNTRFNPPKHKKK